MLKDEKMVKGLKKELGQAEIELDILNLEVERRFKKGEDLNPRLQERLQEMIKAEHLIEGIKQAITRYS